VVLYKPGKRELINRVDDQQHGEKSDQSFQLHTCRFWGPGQASGRSFFKEGKYSGFEGIGDGESARLFLISKSLNQV
jgi:type II restriction/modification system DNA methylase subunit YeeA